MQNFEQIFSEFGVVVPDEKKAELMKRLGENYRTKVDYDKVVEKRDEYKNSLDSVQNELEKFKDVNVDELQNKISTLTTQLTDEKNARAADARKAELEKQVNAFLDSTDEKGSKKYEFLNSITADYYREELKKALDDDSAKGKSIETIFADMVTDKDGKQKAGIFVDKGQQQANSRAARFTTQVRGAGGTSPTKEDFAKMNLDERIKLKNEDPDLYEALRS